MLTGQSELETIRDPPSLDVGKFAGIIDASAEGLLEKIATAVQQRNLHNVKL